MSIPPPETLLVDTHRVSCDGSSGIRGGAGYRPAALGHPRVFLEIDEHGFVDCGYCDRRFVLRGGVADRAGAGAGPGHP
jgi:NADH dehydrogenase (ubiquinone) Fe-S protein 6